MGPELTVRQTHENHDYIEHLGGIPIVFIMYVCILLAATSRAFPTAHGTPAITIYLFQRGWINWDVALSRMVGGFIGSVLTLIYYYIWYVWPGRKQRDIAEGVVQNLIVGPPAFLLSHLQLPNEMNKKN